MRSSLSLRCLRAFRFRTSDQTGIVHTLPKLRDFLPGKGAEDTGQKAEGKNVVVELARHSGLF